jgi:hypothetical protein
MPAINNLLAELDERYIAQKVGLPHDEARLKFRLSRNVVTSWPEFEDIVGRYVSHHFAQCVATGGEMSPTEAKGRAKEIIEREYRRRHADLMTAFNDAHDGTNGGMRALLDIIADGMKFEAVERHIRDVFDRHVAPNSWGAKVEIIKQLIAHLQPQMTSSIQADQPERYAQNYSELIRAYVNELHHLSPLFRRL